MTGDGSADDADDADTGDDRTAANDGIEATYTETDEERVLEFVRAGTGTGTGTGTGGTTAASAAIAQNIEGYAMLKVRPTAEGDELERYYGFDMALDHAAELLGVSQYDLPVPDAAEDMGM
ncbi:hypothetical protein SAMN05444422_11913 [Halobiforma haloterrestris]|uniref:Uncharacterized protein n=1 Tax=Natronobacterium haloterrestre TaxID=148448 RepID=A0A1I1LXL8_NATHA|nr:hypothetical protein [Halobiforma haloterrestris]SFC74200.1 hypothetical protein SAMN05444422_11913 [Halobiforma haloterrestris]